MRALDYAVAIGGRSVHCMPAMSPWNSGRAAEEVFISNLTRAGASGGFRTTLLIEPINPRDRPGYFLNRVEQAADIIGKVGRANLRIQFDFYHVQIFGGDLIRCFEAHLPLISHVQIAAVPSRHEPDKAKTIIPRFAVLDRSLPRLCRL